MLPYKKKGKKTCEKSAQIQLKIYGTNELKRVYLSFESVVVF